MDHHPRPRTMCREVKTVLMDREWKPDLHRPEKKKRESQYGTSRDEQS